MSGVLQAVFMNHRSFAVPPGQQAYTTTGTYTWVAPAGVTSVSVVTVGGGGGNGTTAGGAATPGNNGTANLGGGGGGQGGTAGVVQSGSGGAGGSGIVILKYSDTKTISNPDEGLTFTTSSVLVAGYKITTFTAGTGTIQFS